MSLELDSAAQGRGAISAPSGADLFTSLDAHVLRKIFSTLCVRDVVHLSMTCRQLHSHQLVMFKHLPSSTLMQEFSEPAVDRRDDNRHDQSSSGNAPESQVDIQPDFPRCGLSPAKNAALANWIAHDVFPPECIARHMRNIVLFGRNSIQLASVDLVLKQKPTSSSVMMAKAHIFQWACSQGLLDKVKFLYQVVGLSEEEIRCNDNAPLIVACGNGHLDVVRHLFEAMMLTIEDARAPENDALRCACRDGHDEVVKYLVENVGLGLEDVVQGDCVQPEAPEELFLDVEEILKDEVISLLAGDPRLVLVPSELVTSALRDACEKGNLHIVRYLANAVGLSKQHFQVDRNCILRRACKRGDVPVMKYLHETVGLTAEDARDGGNVGLKQACAKGHFRAVRYLCFVMGLTDEDIMTKKAAAVNLACLYGHRDIVCFLLREIMSGLPATAREERRQQFLLWSRSWLTQERGLLNDCFHEVLLGVA